MTTQVSLHPHSEGDVVDCRIRALLDECVRLTGAVVDFRCWAEERELEDMDVA